MITSRHAHQRQRQRQRGVVLVTSLLFLLVVTIISITAANNSSVGLKMSTSMQDTYRSFQAAEAGVYSTLALAGSAQDPFRRLAIVEDPFQGIGVHPLRNIAGDPNDANFTIDVDVRLIGAERACLRPPNDQGGTSVGLTDCDYYLITSEHDLEGTARTRVELGVIKTVIGSRG